MDGIIIKIRDILSRNGFTTHIFNNLKFSSRVFKVEIVEFNRSRAIHVLFYIDEHTIIKSVLILNISEVEHEICNLLDNSEYITYNRNLKVDYLKNKIHETTS